MRNNQQSQVDNRGASYQGVGAVYNAPVTTIVQDNAVTYEVDPEDTEGMERLSMFLMKHLGETKMLGGALGAFLTGILSLVGWYKLPGLQVLLFAGVGFLVVAGVLWAAIEYKYDSRCVKCNTFYAMEEASNPVVREVEARGGVRRTTTRTFGCRNCGDKVTRKSTEYVEDEPDSED